MADTVPATTTPPAQAPGAAITPPALTTPVPSTPSVPAPPDAAPKAADEAASTTDEETVLVVDDDAATRDSLETALDKNGYKVLTAANAREALNILDRTNIDVVVTDLRMPDLDGLQFFQFVRQRAPNVPVIMISGQASVEAAVSAMRDGVVDFLTKPFSLSEIRRVIARALTNRRLAKENARLREALARAGQNVILGESAAIRMLLDDLDRIGPTQSAVLIMGESGTGKELVAEAIHTRSRRANKPLLKVNCAALVDTLLESELFGHEKGSFTGAEARRSGRFEKAHGSTIFLDEVGELAAPLQAKLLRVLENGVFERVGSNEPVKVDVRILAASNRDLEAEVKAGRFRQDLYYRLSVIQLRLPPLRERLNDVPLLATHFLQTFANENQKQIDGFNSQAMAALTRYSWPGNVRELRNAIERAVVMARSSEITMDDLPPALGGKKQKGMNLAGQFSVKVGTSMEDIERDAITHTLAAVGGDKEAAARILGIGLTTLYRRLKQVPPPKDVGVPT
ncbi:MAG TPA: sigma-54 dependent transcriptional regulator [Planctomycetota bacterium]|nr:sigma-54 dependent transcriptional regulator [Planctomycetota bacterium]